MRGCASFAFAALLASCVGDLHEVQPDGSCVPGEEPLFPLAVGNWWIYRTTDSVTHAEDCKVNFVKGVEPTPSGPVYEIDKIDMAPNTSWLLDTGTGLGWKRKLWKGRRAGVLVPTEAFMPLEDDFYEATRDHYFDPFMLRLDYSIERLCPLGHQYRSEYAKRIVDVVNCEGWPDVGACAEQVTEEEVGETWTVVRPPDDATWDGELVFCVHRELDRGMPSTEGTFCFVRGVGKVFENTGELERLLDYCVSEGDGDVCPDPPPVSAFPECAVTAAGMHGQTSEPP